MKRLHSLWLQWYDILERGYCQDLRRKIGDIYVFLGVWGWSYPEYSVNGGFITWHSVKNHIELRICSVKTNINAYKLKKVTTNLEASKMNSDRKFNYITSLWKINLREGAGGRGADLNNFGNRWFS